MSTIENINRYNLIVNKLKMGSASFKEILTYLEKSSVIQQPKISKRTFSRDIVNILSLLSIHIQYSHSEKAYKIIDNQDDEDTRSEINERIIAALNVTNLFKSAEGFNHCLDFEKRKRQGTENLSELLYAINNKFQIKFTYHKFWEEKPTQRTVEPYALKEFENRWYVLAKDLKDGKDGYVKSFALDRLKNLVITNHCFIFLQNYDIKQAYQYCFGIISPQNEPPQEIILSFDAFQGKYIKTLPLHHTQEILLDNEIELQIKLKLCITTDFIMELLSHGQRLKVLQPQSLIDTIKQTYQNALNQYL